MVITKGERGWGRTKWVKGVKFMVTEGNKNFGRELTTEYTDIKL